MSLLLLITALPGLVAFAATTWAAVRRRRVRSASAGSRDGRRSAACVAPSRSALAPAPADGATAGVAGPAPRVGLATSPQRGGAS
ncbi:hypothetical protein FHR81_002729 [Actinoalloteichus hoggarensis]|uniref:Uncharacterized protein n=1 Tax=Actinoalloteichus hoggarensis TaxID=1470176 RepID=A0A221VXR0_9PSEU|nr:hypothetical protein AHOG_03340 [Actinoalloteichus hoggarensis]MBB5921689.1 hypothetical protein [Actinoalloteichus hoggarensis]